jgi:hypothetical protein
MSEATYLRGGLLFLSAAALIYLTLNQLARLWAGIPHFTKETASCPIERSAGTNG